MPGPAAGAVIVKRSQLTVDILVVFAVSRWRSDVDLAFKALLQKHAKKKMADIDVVNGHVLGCCERQNCSESAGVGHGRVRVCVVDSLLHVLPLQNHMHLESIDRHVEIAPDFVVKA